MVQRKPSPYSNFNFTIKFGVGRGNSAVGRFEEIDGLSAPDTTARARMPGLHKHTNLTLKRGVLGGALFRVWNSALKKGRPVPGTLKIIPHDKAIQQWTFTNVYPAKITGPELKSEGNDISVETIEITAEGVALEKGCDH
jgi:phage tail-like protein